MKRHAQVAHETAEMLAIQALSFIAGEPDQLARFLDMSGIAPDEIRAAAREVAFLAGVLEHMLGDESLLVAFAESAGIDPGEIAQARVALNSPEGRKPP